MQFYDHRILETVAAADRPLRHSEIAARVAPGDNRAWNQIGTSLTRLYRAGALSRIKLDGRYWHYKPGNGAGAETYQETITRLTAERDRARGENAYLRQWLCSELTIADADIDAALKQDSIL
jgi:hypothetical protein